MPVTFRKAAASDIDAVTAIYDAIHTEEEAGRAATGWKRGIYPVRATAEAALTRGDLFVAEADGRVAAAAVLNQIQVDVYAGDAVAYIRQLATTLYVRGIDIDDAYVMQQSRLLHEVSIYSKSVLPGALQSHVGNGSRMCPEYLLQLLLPLYLRVNDRPGKLFIYIHHVKSKNAEDASRPLRTNIITKKYLRYQSMISTQP